MAARYDVAARLAEGREAVAHTQTYLAACRLRGYQHPDLTAHGAQLSDWYDGEDGMDLRLLDGDCSALWALVDGLEEALRVQRGQFDGLAAAWRGPGGDAAAQFLRDHCAAGAALVAGVRAAADACGTLRDELWRLVDDKVGAAIGIDARVCGQRPAWLAAAHTVTTGAGDTETAGDVIDHQVTPYVDTDIRADWITAMRSARGSVATAYETAASAAAPGLGVVFPIPGELGPRYLDEPAATVSAASVPPAGGALPVGPPIDPSPAGSDPLAGPLDDLAGLPTDPGLPGGFGMPAGAGGLGGVLPRIADAIGGLLGSPGRGLSDSGLDEPWLDEPIDEPIDDENLDDDGQPDEADGSEPVVDEDGEPEPVIPAEEVAEEVPAAETPADAAPADDALPVPEDSPAAQGDTPEKTPCEIAADELPQVGR